MEDDRRAGALVGRRARGGVHGSGRAGVEQHHDALVALVEDIGGDQGAHAGAAAQLPTDLDPQRAGRHQATGSAYTP